MVGKSVVITGATGMIGGITLLESIASEEVGRVTTIGRRAPAVSHRKLNNVVHTDFLDLSAIENELRGVDVALFCLGAYSGAVPEKEFREVTLDYPAVFAKALKAQSPGATFCLLSGGGADPSGHSRMAFARYKGAAETAVCEVGFPRIHLFRPSYIYPIEPRHEPNLGYRISRALYPLVHAFGPNFSITSEQLGRAMVEAGLHGTKDHVDPVLENRDILAVVGE